VDKVAVITARCLVIHCYKVSWWIARERFSAVMPLAIQRLSRRHIPRQVVADPWIDDWESLAADSTVDEKSKQTRNLGQSPTWVRPVP